jgi:hypothetical protein
MVGLLIPSNRGSHPQIDSLSKLNRHGPAKREDDPALPLTTTTQEIEPVAKSYISRSNL